MATDEQERMLRERLAEAGARAPVGDPEATWQRTTHRIGQRRRRRTAASAMSLALLVLAGAVTVPAAWEAWDDTRESEVVLEPAPAEDVEPDAAPLTDPDTPDDAPPAPPVAVPRDWETVELDGALITVPPEWAQLHYEQWAADAAQRACPEGEPALIVAHDVRPAGCPADDAAMSEGLVVAPTDVAQDAVLFAADGARVSLPEAPARGRPLEGSLLMAHHADDRDRELLVVPGVGDGLVAEVVGGDGAVAALAAGEDLLSDDAALDERARRVRRALATLRPVDAVERDAVAVGRNEHRVAMVDGTGASRVWDEVPTPVRTAAMPDHATGGELVAAVHAGERPAELTVLAGDRGDMDVAYRSATSNDADIGDDIRRSVTIEPMWAEGRAYVAWVQPGAQGVQLRVVGWHQWEALLAGDEPDTDATVALEVPDGLEAPLAPVSWHEHAPDATTLELGLRTAPEGFTRERWGMVLPFDGDGGVQLPQEAALRPLNP